MRLTVIFLLALAALFFALAAASAFGGRTEAGTVTAPGLVKSLADGPHHALVEVSPPGGRSFIFPANVEGGLQPGQRVTVRYAPDRPLETAEAVTSGAGGGAWGLLVTGLAFLAAAALSPLLVRWFPGLLAPRLRP